MIRTMRSPFVAGNWKMHGSLASSRVLAAAIVARAGEFSSVQVALFPPFPYLLPVVEMVSGRLGVGAQNVSNESPGAMTGEVSAEMLVDIGCRHVLVGHSERRRHLGETDLLVAAKFERALATGLAPVLCVGESLEERDAGDTESVVIRQLGAVLESCGAKGLASGIVAYEPVWAIGTGRTASPEEAQTVHASIRASVTALDADVGASLRVVYGGSVKPDNAASLFQMPDIDGGLIGGASLDVDGFIDICRAAVAS